MSHVVFVAPVLIAFANVMCGKANVPNPAALIAPFAVSALVATSSLEGEKVSTFVAHLLGKK